MRIFNDDIRLLRRLNFFSMIFSYVNVIVIRNMMLHVCFSNRCLIDKTYVLIFKIDKNVALKFSMITFNALI